MDTGMSKITWAAQYMPVLRTITERFAAERPARGSSGSRWRSTSRPRRRTSFGPSRLAGPRWRSRAAIPSRPRTTSRPHSGDRGSPMLRAPCLPGRRVLRCDRPGARYPADSDHRRRHGSDPSAPYGTARAPGRRDRRVRGDHDRHPPAPGDGGRREARVPRHRRERYADEALVRQRPRHGRVGARLADDHHERADRGQAARRGRVRLLRPGARAEGEGDGRAGDRDRGGSAPCARGAHGRLRRDAHGRGGRVRRHLRHDDGGRRRDHRTPLPAHEGRSDPRERGPLQRRDRPRATPRARGRGRAARRDRDVHPRGPAHPRPRRGPAGQPRDPEGDGPPDRGDGPLLRGAGPLGRVHRPVRARSGREASTRCRPRSTRPSRARNSPRSAIAIDRLTDEQARYLSAWDVGT